VALGVGADLEGSRCLISVEYKCLKEIGTQFNDTSIINIMYSLLKCYNFVDKRMLSLRRQRMEKGALISLDSR
jgi:hypothetical protein